MSPSPLKHAKPPFFLFFPNLLVDVILSPPVPRERFFAVNLRCSCWLLAEGSCFPLPTYGIPTVRLPPFSFSFPLKQITFSLFLCRPRPDTSRVVLCRPSSPLPGQGPFFPVVIRRFHFFPVCGEATFSFPPPPSDAFPSSPFSLIVSFLRSFPLFPFFFVRINQTTSFFFFPLFPLLAFHGPSRKTF